MHLLRRGDRPAAGRLLERYLRPGRKAVLALILVFAAGLAEGAALEDLVDELDRPLFSSDDHDDDDDDLSEERVLASLDLTAEQRVRIERVFESREDRLEAYWDARLPELERVIDSGRAEIRAMHSRRTIMTDRTLAGALALALALTAVPASPAEAQGEERYRLVEVAGSALPVEVEREWSCREYVTDATLTLRADSRWRMQYTKCEVCGNREEIETEDEDGRYSVVADTIRFHDEHGDDDERDWNIARDIDVDELATATRALDGALMGRLRDGKTTLVFRR